MAKYVFYEYGAVRWRRHTKNTDARAHRPTSGWEAEAMLLDRHPYTGRQLPTSQWWFREIYIGKDE